MPAGLSRTTATTKAKANDEFSVNVTDIKSNTATVTFTPKDQTQQYYCFIVSDETRDLMIEKYGSIEAADQAYWDYIAGQYDMDLDFYLNQTLFRGTKTVDAKEFTGQARSPRPSTGPIAMLSTPLRARLHLPSMSSASPRWPRKHQAISSPSPLYSRTKMVVT